jgi:hypothetical protein
MEELLKIKDLTEPRIIKNEGYILTYLDIEQRLSHLYQIDHEGESLAAFKFHDKKDSFKTIYLLAGTNGKIYETYHEKNGDLSCFFKSPSGRLFVSVILHYNNKKHQILLPVFDRKRYMKAKPDPLFSGDFIGNADNLSLFLRGDELVNDRQDRLLRIQFDNDRIRKKGLVKIELPSNNLTFIENGRLHLLGRYVQKLIHRIVSPEGTLIKQREIDIKGYVSYRVLSLSFDKPSIIIAIKDDSIYLISIYPDNEFTEEKLISHGKIIEYLGNGIEITGGYLFGFTHKSGNGWFVIKEKRIIECYIHDDEKGYRDLISNNFIDIGYIDIILNGANKTADNGYMLCFEGKNENRNYGKIIFLNRKI